MSQEMATVTIDPQEEKLLDAEILDRRAQFASLTVQEAAHGDRLTRGMVLVAPGGFHLRFDGLRRVLLDQGPRRNGLRPALDVSMESAATHHGPAVIGVILTGMGSDGPAGACHIKAAGGKVITEHEATNVVYGMSRSVTEAGLVDQVVPLPEVASTLMGLIE